MLNRKTYYLLSFIEGACVMAAELLGAKMLAPYFGSSLYVWSTVLAITLGGLALGYFAGGEISYRNKNKLLLFYVVLLGALFLMCMPFASKFLLHYLQNTSLIPALIFSSLLFLMPPVFMMGMVSPLIIAALSEDTNNAGRVAGRIYAISTVGGILATFLLGFHIIPEHGLTKPALAFGMLLGSIPLYAILKNKKYLPVLFFLSLWISLALKPKQPQQSDIKILYSSEGILGQLMVVDYPIYKKEKVDYYSRILFCNRIIQTVYNPGDTVSQHAKYVDLIAEKLSGLKAGSKVVLLGMGGGVLANVLCEQGFEVDAVEFDARTIELAKRYYNLNSKVQVYLDDARHYLNSCPKKYDAVIFDVFKGEESPNHIITMESLQKVKTLLNPNGLIVLNGNGYLQNNAGKGMRSIYKTLLRSGFSVNVATTGNKEAYRNVLFFAGSFTNTSVNETIDTTNALVLLDEYPVLDILNKEANRAWRVGYIQNSLRDFENRNIPLFD
jgi:spermidine synthase